MNRLWMSVVLLVMTGCGSELAEDDELQRDPASPTATAEDDLSTVDAQAACADVSGTVASRSLAVTDAVTLSKFSFKRVMDRIRTTGNAGLTTSTLTLYQQWMATFGARASSGNCTDASVDPNNYGLECPRAPEAKLASIDPFAADAAITFEPVALMNRFDLAPKSGSNCGEYRIVYAMNGQTSRLRGRAFVIFEAALPNPTPSAGLDGCLPVARFWQSLSKVSTSSRAAKLEKFYFTGGAVPGFAAVVDAKHFGQLKGQVRTNFFIDVAEWQLREFKVARTCTDNNNPQTCRLHFAHVPVRSNPAEELFSGRHAKSADFRAHFSRLMPKLLSSDINLISLPTSNEYNEFESVSSQENVDYRAFQNIPMNSMIQARLRELGSPLSVDNVLDRATTQTCAGCHNVSNGVSLGGSRRWPTSLGFTHVDEAGRLSPALTGTFLPHRKAVLEKFINDRCSGAAIADDGLTIGGSPEGSPN